METRDKRLEVEKEQDWRGEAEAIPPLCFSPYWLVQIIPPYGNVVVRFRVTLPSGLKKKVFLDCDGSLIDKDNPGLGFDARGKPIPYWEVEPVGKKIARCPKDDIENLLKYIAYEEEE
jgi:hypothetical protein